MFKYFWRYIFRRNVFALGSSVLLTMGCGDAFETIESEFEYRSMACSGKSETDDYALGLSLILVEYSCREKATKIGKAPKKKVYEYNASLCSVWGYEPVNKDEYILLPNFFSQGDKNLCIDKGNGDNKYTFEINSDSLAITVSSAFVTNEVSNFSEPVNCTTLQHAKEFTTDTCEKIAEKNQLTWTSIK